MVTRHLLLLRCDLSMANLLPRAGRSCPSSADRERAAATQHRAAAGMTAGVSRLAGPDTDSAPTTTPPSAKTGAATATSPGSSSSMVRRSRAAARWRVLRRGVLRLVTVRSVRCSSLPFGSSAAPKASSTLPSAAQCSGTVRPTQFVPPIRYLLSTWAICSTSPPSRATPRLTVSPVSSPSSASTGWATLTRSASAPPRQA